MQMLGEHRRVSAVKLDHERHEFSEIAAVALDAAARQCREGRRVDTRDVLLALMRVDVRGEWDRIWLEFGSTEAVAAAAVTDPVADGDDLWLDVPLTGTCAAAVRAARLMSQWYDMLPVGASVLALCLAGEPSSAAAQSLTGGVPARYPRLIQQLQEALMGGVLGNLPRVLSACLDRASAAMVEFDPIAVGAALERFFDAETWEESRRIAEEHPELLTEQVDTFLGALILAAGQQGDAGREAHLSRHRELLRQVRGLRGGSIREKSDPRQQDAEITTFHASGDRTGEAAARRRRAVRLSMEQRFNEAADEFARVAGLHLELGAMTDAGRAELACAGFQAMAGRLEESLPHFSKAADLLAEHGSVEESVVAEAAWLTTLVQLEQDELVLARCEVILDRTVDEDSSLTVAEARMQACYHKARLMAGRGLLDADWSIAASCAAETIRRTAHEATPENRAIESQMRMIIGNAHRVEGRFAESADEFAIVVEIGNELGNQTMAALALGSLGRVLLEVPDVGAKRFRMLTDRYHADGQRYAEATCRYERARCIKRLKITPWSLEASLERNKICAEENERAGELFDAVDAVREAGDAYYQAGYALSAVAGFEPDCRQRCAGLLETAARRFGAASVWWGRGLAEHLNAYVAFMHPQAPDGEARSLELLHDSVVSFQKADRPTEEAMARLEIAVQIGMQGIWSDEWLDAIFTWLASHERARAAMVVPHQRESEDRQVAQLLPMLIGQLLSAVATRGTEERWRRSVWRAAQAVKGRAFLDQQIQHDAWSHLIATDAPLRELTSGAERARIELENAERELQAALFAGGMDKARKYALERDRLQTVLNDREREQRQRLDLVTQERPQAMRLLSSEPAEPADIQAVLRSDELYLEYFWQYGRLVRFTVTQDGWDISIPELEQSSFVDWLKQTNLRVRHAATLPGSSYTHALLGDIPSGVNTVIVCPHGELVGLPWHLLPVNSSKIFGDACATSIVPSAGYLVRVRTDAVVSAQASYLGVAYDAHDRDDLPRLPNADREVTQIALTYFSGEAAASANHFPTAESGAFLTLRRSVKVLHLASHANRGGLHLRRTVTPVDLLDLGVRADIILLTGCDAGDFSADNTNEFLGIVRQLLIVTHARAAIVSLSAVLEASAPTVSGLIIAALTGATPLAPVDPSPGPLAVGPALRWARQQCRELLEGSTDTDVAWWSPWFVIGDPQAGL
ncbi:CHAT domain-containing protein [Sphaerisporangium aureirubrum]|uniref:CHAT domain-containing protein n=1 Tax=Sphaerisporangium aureirubrum TaxID=1544736 RepID=A0ABW1NMF9_9ACTN